MIRVTAPWDPAFERVLRAHLPHFPAEASLQADQSLPAVGLDSVGMMRLLVALEDGYGFAFPPEAVAPSTFRTPRTIWSVVSQWAGRSPARR